MSGLLYLEKGMSVKIMIRNKRNYFQCTDITEFENAQNYLCTRYFLSHQDDDSRYILDVQKDSMQNISLICYQLIEEMDFDLNFLSLVGTSPLGYHNPQIPNIDYILYEKIENYYEDKEVIKFLVTNEEVPHNPEEKGYYQDGSGNWYFLSERSHGTLLRFRDDYKLSWEYKQEQNERLLIELQAFTNMNEYMHQQPTIYIYEGEKLHRRDIKVLPQEVVKESNRPILDKSIAL